MGKGGDFQPLRSRLGQSVAPFGGLRVAYAPDPPPVDWIYPRSLRSNAPWEYTTLARWTTSHRPPYILLNRGYERAFLADDSPLGEVLAKYYTPSTETRWGLLLKRIPR